MEQQSEAMNDHQAESSATKATTVTIRTLRPPGTVRKTPHSAIAQNPKLTSYIAQNRFRLLNPPQTAPPTSSSTSLGPLQRLQQQASEHLNQTHYKAQSSSATDNNVATNTMVLGANGLTSAAYNQPLQQARPPVTNTRLPPPGRSGLARPTPLQQIVTSTGMKTPQKRTSGNISIVKTTLATERNNHFGSSTQLRPSSNLASHGMSSQASIGSHSKLAPMVPRPRTATTLIRPRGAGQNIVSSTTFDKRKVGVGQTENMVVPPASEPRLRSQTTIGNVTSSLTSEQTLSNTLGENHDPAAYLINLSSVENDVGEIRRLLEQLLCLLQTANQDQANKERENEKLRQEVRELKSKIRSIRSTVAANADSEPPTPSVPHHVAFRQDYDLPEESPPTDSETRNDGFTIQRRMNDVTIAGNHDRECRDGSRSVVDDHQQQHQQSVYLSPLN